METKAAGSTLYFVVNTHKADGTPITWAGSPAVAVTKDGGTTTETDGVSLTVDAGSVTGRHIITIDTSQDGTFFATGHKFSVIVTAGTVDSVSTVGVIVAEFELGSVPADVQAWDGGSVPTPAEAGAAMTLTEAYDAAKTAAQADDLATVDANVDSILSDTNEIQQELADGGRTDLLIDGIASKTVNLPGDPADQSAVEAAISAAHATTDGKIDGLNNLSTADIASAVSLLALEATVAALNDLSQAEAQAAALAAIQEYDPPTKTEMDDGLSGIVVPTVDEINTKLETEHGAGSWGAQGAYTITPTTPLTDSVSGDPISGMTVKIYSNALRTETYLITEVTSDTEGSFTAHVTASGTYYLRAIKEGYTTLEWTEVAA